MLVCSCGALKCHHGVCSDICWSCGRSASELTWYAFYAFVANDRMSDDGGPVPDEYAYSA